MALFSLELEKQQFWTDDLNLISEKLCLARPEKREWVKYLYAQAVQPNVCKDDFLSEFAPIKKWFDKTFATLLAETL